MPRPERHGRNVFFVSETCHPQTIDVVQTRAKALGIEVVVGDHRDVSNLATKFSARWCNIPTRTATIHDYRDFRRTAHQALARWSRSRRICWPDLAAPPGEFGADIAVGSAQRFGVPLGYGGPHAAFFATRDAFKRQMPGRIVGVSKDSRGRPALRLALQTREQHIRREKATSNICTAQALLANMASMYAVYHGPEGLRKIARTRPSADRTFWPTGLKQARLRCRDRNFLRHPARDLGAANSSGNREASPEATRINLRRHRRPDTSAFPWMKPRRRRISTTLLEIFNGGKAPTSLLRLDSHSVTRSVSSAVSRAPVHYLTHPVFNRYHSETEMLRYIRRLESRDLSLTTSMIPLGSCTMKLNATAEMFPVTWPEFGEVASVRAARADAGLSDLSSNSKSGWRRSPVSRRFRSSRTPVRRANTRGCWSFAQYHAARGEAHRNICLIPTSAHGTNPASAVMAGMKVVAVACDEQGNIDVADLRAKAEAHKSDLAALMVTYPSTHGVFEETIKEICEIIHANGGQVYMDGANMNAQVGLVPPGGHGRGRLPSESAQDILHSARRRRSGHGADRRGGASGAIFARASGGRTRRRKGIGRGFRRAVGQREHPADFLGLHRADGRRLA